MLIAPHRSWRSTVAFIGFLPMVCCSGAVGTGGRAADERAVLEAAVSDFQDRMASMWVVEPFSEDRLRWEFQFADGVKKRFPPEEWGRSLESLEELLSGEERVTSATGIPLVCANREAKNPSASRLVISNVRWVAADRAEAILYVSDYELHRSHTYLARFRKTVDGRWRLSERLRVH